MFTQLSLQTHYSEEFIEITQLIQKEIAHNKISEGVLTLFIPHTTAGLTINENADPDVKADMLKGLNSLKLEKLDFKHAEGNSPAHIKASLMGNSLQVIIHKGRLILGTWQGIYFCEFDGPRKRKIFIKILS